MSQKSYKFSKGLTLIEMLVSMALISLLSLAIVGLQFIISQNQVAAWRSYNNVDEANISVSSFVREVRASRSGENGAFTIESANDNNFTFYSDIDYDGLTEKIRYSRNSNVLEKGVTDPVGYPATYPADQERVKILSENIQNDTDPIFYYYNDSWPQDAINNPLLTPADPVDIKLIKIYLILNNIDNEPEHDYILESFTSIRMEKENL